MYYLKEMRISHYIKNGLILLPIIFSGNLKNIRLLCLNLIFVLCFSFMSSVIYIINDIKDAEKDKLHSVKKTRPIASGRISVKNALIFASVLFVVSFGTSGYISVSYVNLFPLIVMLLYFIANILYSVFGFKNIPLLDVCILTLGFYLRVLLGASVSNVEISAWLYLIVIFGAFYLGFGKRRNELIKNKGYKTRKVLSAYSIDFLDKSMFSCLILSIVFFSFWCMEKNSMETRFNYLMLVPLLMVICFKYNMNIEDKSNDGDPVSVILKDKVLIILAAIFMIAASLFIYIN